MFTVSTLRLAPLLGVVVCLNAALTCARAQTVKVNWRQKAPFADYKTYSWSFAKGQENSFYRQFVRVDVDEQLAKKGLQKVAAVQGHDLIVTYHLVTQELMDSTTTSDGLGLGGGVCGGWGGGGGWGGWGVGMNDMDDMATTEAQPRTMGILVVDLVDARTKQVVWRGQATEDSLASSQKGDEKQVKKSVDKMFDRYPPKQE
jgi:hypothetical protein